MPIQVSKAILTVADIALTYTIKRSKRRRRTLTLSLHPHEGLIVLTPWRTRDQEVHTFLETNQEWILSKMKGFTPLPRYELSHAESLFFAGMPCSLHIGESKRSKVTYEDHKLSVAVKPYDNADDHKKMVYQQVKKFCYRSGYDFLCDRLDFWKEKLGVHYHSMKITDPKHRWGSCDTKNIIRLNWRIMLTPLDLIDYLMVHELCHVKFKNHSKDYWAFVASVMPDHRERRQLLHRDPAGFLRY